MATARQDEELKLCQWPPALRWLLFLPAGCVGCVLAILFVRYLYWFCGEGWFGENAFLVEYAVRAAEPIGFLAAALWVLPRFHRIFTVLFAVPYCGFWLLVITERIVRLDSPWRDGSLATVSLVSGICAAIFYFRRYTKPGYFAQGKGGGAGRGESKPNEQVARPTRPTLPEVQGKRAVVNRDALQQEIDQLPPDQAAQVVEAAKGGIEGGWSKLMELETDGLEDQFEFQPPQPLATSPACKPMPPPLEDDL